MQTILKTLFTDLVDLYVIMNLKKSYYTLCLGTLTDIKVCFVCIEHTKLLIPEVQKKVIVVATIKPYYNSTLTSHDH